jgi:putative spermidine/putrescine transport system substrate-binding protein
MKRSFASCVHWLIACLAVGSTSGCSQQAGPQDEAIVVVAVGGGEWAEANIEAYAKPFEKETGIKVIAVREDIELSTLKLMHDTGSVEIDVADLGAVQAALANRNGYLQAIDYQRYDVAQLADMPTEVKAPWGVGALYYSLVLGYDATRVGTGEPQTWADFWNVARFPGPRALMNGRLGVGPIEEALLADGVVMEHLYPLDLERAFRKLDAIKPHIIKWWTAGSEAQQLFRDRLVVLGGIFDGRLAALRDSGRPVAFTYNQGKRFLDYWVIPKGAPHGANAQRFVEFATRAANQAAFVQRIAYGPTNLGALRLLPPELAKRLPSHPDNMARQFALNAQWYGEVGPDGVSNLEHVVTRWNAWALE